METLEIHGISCNFLAIFILARELQLKAENFFTAPRRTSFPAGDVRKMKTHRRRRSLDKLSALVWMIFLFQNDVI